MSGLPVSVHSYRKRTMAPTPLPVIRERWTSIDDAPSWEERLALAENYYHERESEQMPPEEFEDLDFSNFPVVTYPVIHEVDLPSVEEMLLMADSFNEGSTIIEVRHGIIPTPAYRPTTSTLTPRGRQRRTSSSAMSSHPPMDSAPAHHGIIPAPAYRPTTSTPAPRGRQRHTYASRGRRASTGATNTLPPTDDFFR